jgi:hypothetical protein
VKRVSRCVVICFVTGEVGGSSPPVSFLTEFITCIIKMSKRRSWVKEEDDAIRTLVSEFGIKQWTTVAKELDARYGLLGRTGK